SPSRRRALAFRLPQPRCELAAPASARRSCEGRASPNPAGNVPEAAPGSEAVTDVPVEVTRPYVLAMNEAALPDVLQGSWKVRRVSGLLPPGVTKQIQGDRGRTLLFGLHFGAFRIDGPRFVYLFWP